MLFTVVIVKILNKFLDALYPSHYKCLVCSKDIVSDGVDICDECLELCEVVDSVHGCIKCGATLIANDVVCGACKDIVPVFDKNYSVFVFKDSIKLLLLSLKYNGKKYIASTFSEILYDKYLPPNIMADFPVFNIADCAIVIGAGLIMLSLVKSIIDEQRNKSRANVVAEPQEDNNGDI